MAHKITRAVIAIATCWLLAYGMGSAAIHCCSGKVVNTWGPPGVKGHLNSTLSAHCQPLPGHNPDAERCADRSAWPVLADFNAADTCCSATSCTPVGLTVHPGQLPPTSDGVPDKDAACAGTWNHSRLAHTNHVDDAYRQTVPIFLWTKSILC